MIHTRQNDAQLLKEGPVDEEVIWNMIKTHWDTLIRATRNPGLVFHHGTRLSKNIVARHFLGHWHPVCQQALDEAVILSDGSVTTCCLDPRGENIYGNICETSFKEIWEVNFKKFRDKNLLSRPICFSCVGQPHCFSPPTISRAWERKKWHSPNVLYPKSIVIEISGVCNFACERCYANELRHRRAPFFDFERAKVNLVDLLTNVSRLRLYNFGEPLLNKDFSRILRWIRQVSPDIKIALATNGMLLQQQAIEAIVDARVSSVSISVHGGPGTQGMLRYSKRGADYDVILKNVAALTKYRRRKGGEEPLIRLKAILFNWNDTDQLMQQLRDDSKRVGADGVIWDLDNGTGLTERASKRFKAGNELLARLHDSGEY